MVRTSNPTRAQISMGCFSLFDFGPNRTRSPLDSPFSEVRDSELSLFSVSSSTLQSPLVQLPAPGLHFYWQSNRTRPAARSYRDAAPYTLWRLPHRLPTILTSPNGNSDPEHTTPLSPQALLPPRRPPKRRRSRGDGTRNGRRGGGAGVERARGGRAPQEGAVWGAG